MKFLSVAKLKIPSINTNSGLFLYQNWYTNEGLIQQQQESWKCQSVTAIGEKRTSPE